MTPERAVGLSLEEQAHVWERFYRAPGVQMKSGIGLGLSLCQTIIGKHDGRVDVESVKGKGSTFWLTLPRSPHEGTRPRHQTPYEQQCLLLVQLDNRQVLTYTWREKRMR